MNRRFVLAALPVVLALTAAAPHRARAPARPARPPAEIPLADTVRVAINTELGAIVLDRWLAVRQRRRLIEARDQS